ENLSNSFNKFRNSLHDERRLSISACGGDSLASQVPVQPSMTVREPDAKQKPLPAFGQHLGQTPIEDRPPSLVIFGVQENVRLRHSPVFPISSTSATLPQIPTEQKRKRVFIPVNADLNKEKAEEREKERGRSLTRM
ncbi:hypothetical protein BT69DRAFT_1363574, partial [Atractiella rhizophila]